MRAVVQISKPLIIAGITCISVGLATPTTAFAATTSGASSIVRSDSDDDGDGVKCGDGRRSNHHNANNKRETSNACKKDRKYGNTGKSDPEDRPDDD